MVIFHGGGGRGITFKVLPEVKIKLDMLPQFSKGKRMRTLLSKGMR